MKLDINSFLAHLLVALGLALAPSMASATMASSSTLQWATSNPSTSATTVTSGIDRSAIEAARSELMAAQRLISCPGPEHGEPAYQEYRQTLGLLMDSFQGMFTQDKLEELGRALQNAHKRLLDGVDSICTWTALANRLNGNLLVVPERFWSAAPLNMQTEDLAAHASTWLLLDEIGA
jgi:hypothetical protein